MVYTYIVSQLLSNEDKLNLLQVFKEIDTDNNGVISVEELKKGLEILGKESPEKVRNIMKIVDINSSGTIDYTEFLVAGINMDETLTKKHLERAFSYFDIDHSGFITFEEIQEFLVDDTDEVIKIFKEIDENGDGEISQEEFVNLLMNRVTEKKLARKSEKKVKSLSQTVRPVKPGTFIARKPVS